MKQILVYGDSLSWGIIPGTRQRLGFQQRWPGVLEAQLQQQGMAVRVFENCLNGRRTSSEDPIKPGRNGTLGLAQAIEMHTPLDLVIILLGTNDFQVAPGFSAAEAAQGVAQLIDEIRQAPIEPGMHVPPILVIAPPQIHQPQGTMLEKFSGAAARCDGVAQAYERMCRQTGCTFFDAAAVITVSPIDGVHMDAEPHHRLGLALSDLVKTRFLQT